MQQCPEKPFENRVKVLWGCYYLSLPSSNSCHLDWIPRGNACLVGCVDTAQTLLGCRSVGYLGLGQGAAAITPFVPYHLPHTRWPLRGRVQARLSGVSSELCRRSERGLPSCRPRAPRSSVSVCPHPSQVARLPSCPVS